jgi:CheY-like chemotaxis protein
MEPKHVLIVDDEALVRQLVRTVVGNAGYTSDEAGDGVAAIERLEKRRPDLVLLDLVMPRLDGWGVLTYVAGMEDPPPVVLVSGLHDSVPPGHLNQYVTGFVAKPFDVPHLLNVCREAIAAGPVAPAQGSRKEHRRTFLIETTLLSERGRPLTRGQIVQVSQNGFRAELAVALEPGDRVRVAFQLPPRKEPVTLTGSVRWRTEFTLGAQIEGASEEDTALLRELVAAR